MLPTLRPDTSTRATQAQILQALASLAVLPSRQADDAALDSKMYQIALEGVSRYALNEAVKAIVRGTLGHTFFPTPVEIRQECNRAIEPIARAAERQRMNEEQARECIEFEKRIQARSPEELDRVRAVYEDFCRQHAASKPVSVEEKTVFLDPDLLAQVPDAPSSFKKMGESR